MTCLSFPYLSGKLINLRKLAIDDATSIVNLMDYEIAKYLYQVPYPYRIEDALILLNLVMRILSYVKQ